MLAEAALHGAIDRKASALQGDGGASAGRPRRGRQRADGHRGNVNVAEAVSVVVGNVIKGIITESKAGRKVKRTWFR